MDVALVTCRTLPEPDDDRDLLRAALAERGIAAAWLAWDDPDVSWASARLSLIRSTWNYHLHLDHFLAWAEQTAAVAALWNPLPVISWNAHKSYLLALAEAGVPVVPTRLVRRGEPADLAAAAAGWPVVVVKPAVSAASYRTRRVDAASWAEGEAHLADLLRDRDGLVQPYVTSVEAHGERSLIWVDGAFTHAVRKAPRFSGQAETASSAAVPFGDDEADVAARAIDAARDRTGQPLLYARVDLVRDVDGRPMVAELELIEPSLYLRQGPAALDRLVSAIAARLAGT